MMQFISFHRHKHYMLTEPLYYTCTRRPLKPEVFSYIATFCLFLQNKVGKIYLYFEAFLLKLFNPLAFVGYEMIIANSALHVSCLTIYHLISNTCLWNYCLLATSVLVNSFCLLATSLNGILCQAKCIVSIKLKQVCFHFRWNSLQRVKLMVWCRIYWKKLWWLFVVHNLSPRSGTGGGDSP